MTRIYYGRNYMKGFTLVELAIALMVIGLLIGGVLKGQELIENARMISTIKQLKDYETAIMIFRNTYNGIPGDFKYPQRIPGCIDIPSCMALSGGGSNPGVRGNGIVDNVYGYDLEGVAFWWQMHQAGLVSNTNITRNDAHGGPGSMFNSPVNGFGGHTVITRNTFTGKEKNYFYITDNATIYTSGFGVAMESVRRTAAIDQKIDDGYPWSGIARSTPDTDCSIVVGGGPGNPGNREYNTEGTGTIRCRFYIESESLN